MIDTSKKYDRALLFNRFRFLAFFVMFQFLWVSKEGTTIFGFDAAFFFPVKVFVLPIALATILETSRIFKRYPEPVSDFALWYNAAYMVCLAVAVWWVVQISVLIYVMTHGGQLDISAILKGNGILLIWAIVSIGICRYWLWMETTVFQARSAS
ncbi:hypothetical protein [Ruegeria lacuscaerulensis]|uniref:hypothetical protein n=1 Tax=Ruegeria lacuscaerulensis TaxID=55218 RepID=UPI00147B1EE0|nr:hypothetical protein [Ruegeria lacuscaerulensis]